LDTQGEVAGYEADILNAIGIELGIEIEYVQVTRHNAEDMLLSGQVDVLIGQQPRARNREAQFDFSAPYYVNQERMVVKTEAPYTSLTDFVGLPVSVEIGSRSEHALRHWSDQRGITLDVRTYLSESEALDALANGEVQGMLGELASLRRAGRQQMRLIDEPVLDEYYAMVVRRWDANLLNLLNRSLQRLKASGRLDEIFKQWFPDESIDFTTLVPVYDLLYEDTRQLTDFPADIPYPANPIRARIDSGQPLRVAGIITTETDSPAQVRMINTFNQALVEEMARRWGVQAQYVPGSILNPVDMVVGGQADLAVGVGPRWDGADRVEYSQPYLTHGDRLMIPANKQINTFADLLGTDWIIGYFADDAPDAEHIKKFAEIFGVGQNIREPFAIQRESDAIFTMTTELNIDMIYGDSLRLLALQREYDQPDSVKILDKPYGDDMPVAFAGPRNDADFRDLINATLQDMVRDGTYQRLWTERFGTGTPITIPVWPAVSPDQP
ncbi:MAG: transporter substrate-binding domain-containing protein, partial [Chloroflexi bacterium]|nr:transporter substrate-binding domain-containing protein [Chloroflexota bacterium]